MFGEFLIAHGIINENQLNDALRTQKDIEKPLGETLVHLGYIEKTVLESFLEQHLLHRADDLVNDPDLRSAV
ncbi:MAG: hypothetical protein ACRCUT_04060 [Spirochaetota bacterium]